MDRATPTPDASQAPAPRAPAPGPERIGGLKVEGVLGTGGMGRVYLCRDEGLSRPVAVKTLLPSLLSNDDMRVRFLREARALAKVRSPHVVAVHAVGEDEAVGPYVVMELLHGEDLLQKLQREGPFAYAIAIQAARDAVQGLQAATDVGLVHRDVKPANLFYVDGKAKLTDFGLAREIDSSSTTTQTGIVVGTPAYLAPEVVKGRPASMHSDMYSLGATLFQLVTGRPPFEGDSPLEVLGTAATQPAPLLASVRPTAPRALCEVVDRLLQKSAEARYPRWIDLDEALVRALNEAQTGLPEQAAASSQLSSPTSSRLQSATGTQLFAAPPRAPAALPSLPTLTGPPVALSSSPGLPEGAPDVATRFKTESLTVMFTDIAGYTERTSRQSREESARWLALHDALLQPVFRSFGGRVRKTIGDAFLVTFSSPTDAVLCGCAIQDRLALHNRAAVQSEAIHVRVALSAGEVRVLKGDVFGEPVNLASRLEKLCQAGEVLLSDAVYATMNTAEVRLADRGEHEIKGITRPVRVYAAVPDGVLDQPPFGGRALTRVKEGPGPVDVEAALKKLQQLDVSGAFKRVQQAALWSRLQALPMAAQVALVAVLVLLVGLPLLVWVTGDDRRARIEAGEHKAVLAELVKIPEKQRDGEDWALLGHAELKSGEPEKALKAFDRAVAAGVLDEDALDAAFSLLENKDDQGAVGFIARWPGDEAQSELRELLTARAWWPRHHALSVLDDKKEATDDDRQRVALIDVEGDTCNDRRHGLLALKRVGRGEAALLAVKKLGQNLAQNFCMALDLKAAEDAIAKRTKELDKK